MPAQPQVSDHKSGLAIAEQLAELADYAHQNQRHVRARRRARVRSEHAAQQDVEQLAMEAAAKEADFRRKGTYFLAVTDFDGKPIVQVCTRRRPSRRAGRPTSTG